MVLNPILKFLRDLETFNLDQDFIRYRESTLRSRFTLITMLGLSSLWAFIGATLFIELPDSYLMLRVGIPATALLNAIVSFIAFISVICFVHM